MFIIDAHTHIGQAVQKVYKCADTPEDLIAELQNGGLSGALFCPVNATMCKSEDDLIAGNEEALELYAQHPEFLYPGVGLHPDFFDKSLYFLDKFAEQNLIWTGENLSYHTQITFTDERWMKIFRVCCERNLVVQLHNAPEVAALARALPELTIVGSHLNPDVLPLLADLPNVFIDISGLHGGLCRNTLPQAKALFGCDRLLFGTDYPGYDFMPFIARVKRDFSAEEQQKIFSGNLLNILKSKGICNAFGRTY